MSTVDHEPEKDRARATTLPLDTTQDLPARPADAPAVPDALGGRFFPLRHHARGGLGDVFVARDEELGREVALKTLQARLADEPRNQARFVREAEITGHLEHPGVVPVYGLGRSPDGRPYYAMQLIRGQSLAHAIERFHADEKTRRDPGARAIGLLGLLGSFLNACNAVDFAHSRGIVHRDLKPSNIMLGGHGETLVVDWGLAKRLVVAEDWSSGIGPPPIPGSTGDSDLTLTGSTVGTPAFMSPEQAAGRLDLVGPISDVYNLGATLYCILAGRPPFDEEPVAVIFSRLQRGDFPRPSALAPVRVPRALEAICLKAMALRQEDRYASARALGEDIQRWIAHEPVSAYSEPLGEHLARWSRRHRAWVQAGTITVLALLVTLAAATGLVSRAWRQEQTERREAERLSASLDLDKARNLSEAGATGRGMLRFAHTLAVTPRDATDLRTTILTNLAAWRKPMIPLRDTLEHQGVVYAVAFAPDGQTILTGGGRVMAGTLRGEVRLWNAATGQPRGAPLETLAPVRSVAFSPDGRTFLTGSGDGTARLWDAATATPRGAALAHLAPVEAAAFFPDGESIVTAGGRSVRIWNAADGAARPGLPEQASPVHALAVSHDGRRVLVGNEEGTGQIWNVAARTPFGPSLDQEAPIYSAAFSADDRVVVTGGDAGLVQFWEVESGHRLLKRLVHRSAVFSIAFSNDGQRILTGSDDNTARLWDAATGQAIGSPIEHRGSVLGVAFRPDGAVLLTGSGDGTARLWGELPGAPETAVLHQAARIHAVAFRPDGLALVTGGSDGRAQVWDSHSFQPLGSPFEHTGEVLELAYSPDGATLLCGCGDGTARLWDTATHAPRVGPLEQLGPVGAVAFSPDGKTVLTGGEDGAVRLWVAETGAPLGEPLPQPTEVAALAFHPNGHIILVAAGTAGRFWDLTTRRPLGAPMPHHGTLTSVAFRPDGRVAVTGGEDNTARLWEVATGRPLRDPLDHTATVRAVAFSRDGQLLVTGGNDHRVRFWNVATGAPVGPPLEHQGRVAGVAFSPDGQSVLSGSFDQTARLWPVPTPLEDNVSRIELWVQVLTGMRLDTRLNASGAVQLLDDAVWHQSRSRLEEAGGPPR
jgi:WD40 repeat protein